MDLLLHLIRTHELDVLDLPIAFVTAKYLAYLDLMKKVDLDVASEYLVMAATLAYIKSKMMLPPEPGDGDDDDIPEEEMMIAYAPCSRSPETPLWISATPWWNNSCRKRKAPTSRPM